MTKISKMPIRTRQPVPEQLSQPLPFLKLAFAAAAQQILSAFSSFSGGAHGAPHFLQILRTNRCAISARVAEATKNGFTPMSIKRVTAPGASFVWSVEKT